VITLKYFIYEGSKQKKKKNQDVQGVEMQATHLLSSAVTWLPCREELMYIFERRAQGFAVRYSTQKVHA
jgi:hypothetical protein